MNNDQLQQLAQDTWTTAYSNPGKGTRIVLSALEQAVKAAVQHANEQELMANAAVKFKQQRDELLQQPRGEPWTVETGICHNCATIAKTGLLCATCNRHSLEMIPKPIRDAHNASMGADAAEAHRIKAEDTPA